MPVDAAVAGSTCFLLAFALSHAVIALGDYQLDVVHPLEEVTAETDLSASLGEDASVEDVPRFRMLKTSGTFTLSAASAVPKLNMEMELGEGDEITVQSVAPTEVIDAEVSTVHLMHGDGLDAIDLGESSDLEGDGGFRYTNGEYGGNGGKQKWLKCETKCVGSGYGGYGSCYTKGEGKPWGGCMAPGADPAIEQPPKLYARNRVTTVHAPRAHRFCKTGKDVWIKDGQQLVAACAQCKDDNYFLVPNQHVKNMLVGSCFRIDQFPAWIKAVKAAVEGGSAPLKCSAFMNGPAMQSHFFGEKKKDSWNSAPKTSPYKPRGFVCTTSRSISDYSVTGLLSKGYREMKMFATTAAHFVMCYTDKPDAASLRCVKKKRIGNCKAFSMRNAAFDQKAFHLVSPAINATGVDWDEETKLWDAKALKVGRTKLDPEEPDKAIGLQECSEDWSERLLSLH